MLTFRRAFRFYSRRKFPAALALVTLSLGLAATLAAFSVVDQVLLRTPPIPSSERVVVPWEIDPGEPEGRQQVSPADFLDWKQSGAFEHLAAWMPWNFNLVGSGSPERLRGALASEEFFEVLGVGARMGRTFNPRDAVRGGNGVVVLSHRLWERKFGKDRSIIGRTLDLGDFPVTVIGVMPASFDTLWPEIDLWTPLVFGTHFDLSDRKGRNLRVIGRLADGVSLEEAGTILRTVSSRIAVESPETHRGWSAALATLHRQRTEEVRPTLLVLLIATALMLAIGLANVSNLLLMLYAGRQREFAVKRAIGAGLRILLTEAIAEGVTLGMAVGLGSVGLGVGILNLFRGYGEPVLGRDLGGMALTTAAGGITAALILSVSVTILAMWQSSTSPIRVHSNRVSGSGGRLRGAFLAVQIGMSVALMVSAGVLVRSVSRLTEVDPGFETGGVLTARIWLPGSYETSTEQAALFERVAEQIRQTPGVAQVAMIQDLPLRGNAMTFDIFVEHPRRGLVESQAAYRVVSGGYFELMGIPLIAGRSFHSADGPDAPRVVVVNQRLARREFGSGGALGRRLRIDEQGSLAEIVGVVGDVKQMGLKGDEVAAVYQPLSQKQFDFLRWNTLVMRIDGRPEALIPAIRRAVTEVDPQQPIFQIETVRDVMDAELAGPRLAASLVTGMGAVGFVLMIIGIIGLLSTLVALRTRELGIRMAMGAAPGAILRLVLGEAMRITLAGIVLGLAVAAAGSALLDRLLFDISALDSATLGMVVAGTMLAALAAAAIPARRATRVDPVMTLKAE